MNFPEELEDNEKAIHNAYLVVTGKRSLESFTRKNTPMLPLDFNNPGHLIDFLSDHYDDMEDYEKCDELEAIRNV